MAYGRRTVNRNRPQNMGQNDTVRRRNNARRVNTKRVNNRSVHRANNTTRRANANRPTTIDFNLKKLKELYNPLKAKVDAMPMEEYSKYEEIANMIDFNEDATKIIDILKNSIADEKFSISRDELKALLPSAKEKLKTATLLKLFGKKMLYQRRSENFLYLFLNQYLDLKE